MTTQLICPTLALLSIGTKPKPFAPLPHKLLRHILEPRFFEFWHQSVRQRESLDGVDHRFVGALLQLHLAGGAFDRSGLQRRVAERVGGRTVRAETLAEVVIVQTVCPGHPDTSSVEPLDLLAADERQQVLGGAGRLDRTQVARLMIADCDVDGFRIELQLPC